MQSRLTLQLTASKNLMTHLPRKNWDYACVTMPNSQEFKMAVKKKSKYSEFMNFIESTTGRNLEAYKGFISIHLKNGLSSLLR